MEKKSTFFERFKIIIITIIAILLIFLFYRINETLNNVNDVANSARHSINSVNNLSSVKDDINKELEEKNKTYQNEDEVKSDLNYLIAYVQFYYNKNGDKSLKDMQIPSKYLDTTYGHYQFIIIDNEKYKVIGVGKRIGDDGINPIKFMYIFSPSKVINFTKMN